MFLSTVHENGALHIIIIIIIIIIKKSMIL